MPKSSKTKQAKTTESAQQPVRTCAGCGRRRPQGSLVRLSVDAAGVLQVGRGEGRGAYLCPDADCAEQAQRTRALPRRLHAEVVIPDDFEALLVRSLAGGRKPLD